MEAVQRRPYSEQRTVGREGEFGDGSLVAWGSVELPATLYEGSGWGEAEFAHRLWVRRAREAFPRPRKAFAAHPWGPARSLLHAGGGGALIHASFASLPGLFVLLTPNLSGPKLLASDSPGPEGVGSIILKP